MMKALVALLCLLPGLAFAQSAVQQAGSVTNNSVVMWARDHQIRQGSGAAGDVAGKMPTGGSSVVGNVCSFSNTTDATSYNYLCLDATNGAINYNGTTYPFNASGGNVTGPGSTTIDHVATWGNTVGSVLKDTTSLALTGLTVSPATGLSQALLTTSNMSGTVSEDTWYNQQNIASDNVVGPGHNIFGGGSYQVCCGSSAQGNRFALGGRLDITTPWSAADPNASFVGVLSNARAKVNAPSAAYIGGANNNVEVDANMTGWDTVVVTESDGEVRAGADQPQTKNVHRMVLGALDAVNASGFSAWEHFINLGTSGGMTNLWLVDTTSGGHSILQTTGTILNIRGAMTVQDVFNLNDLTVTGNVLSGPGLTSFITGAGSIFLNKQLYGAGDIGAATYPTSTAGVGWARTSNFSAANAEIIDWNTREANVAGESFEWRQKSGVSASNQLLVLNGQASVLAATVMKLRVNNTGGGENVATVSLGAADSGGAGFRALRVAN